MSAFFSKFFVGLIGVIVVSAIGIWLFWEESSSWINRPLKRVSEPGLVSAITYLD
ncbi:MAG: hypothetical protein AAGD96_30090 [Chloroflexota bacterium]